MSLMWPASAQPRLNLFAQKATMSDVTETTCIFYTVYGEHSLSHLAFTVDNYKIGYTH